MPKESRTYPLSWPKGHERHEKQRRSLFKTTVPTALGELRDELGRQGVSHWFVSTNYPLGRDGWPDPLAKLKDGDPGAAVYWIRQSQRFAMACDAWDKVQDNLHAIFLTLQADRAKVRWGCSGALERSQTGFLELPGPPPEPEWWTILGVPRVLVLDDIRAIYRLRVQQWHPDRAQDELDRKRRTEKLKELNAAMEAAEREISRAS